MEGYARVPGRDPSRHAHLGTQAKSGPKDLVTEYDRRVERYLFEALGRAFPGETVIGEENCAATGKKPAELAHEVSAFWIVDPIDGTTNYSRAYPFFCSTVAYVERSKSGQFVPVAAATWDPLHEELFSAAAGEGAFLNRERLQVTNNDSPQQALLTTGFASERAGSGEKSFELFKTLTKNTLGVRRDGSAALDLAYVAAGRIDAYWEWGLSPWDTAAGILLVRESGGHLSHHDGGEIDLMSGEIVATNGHLHSWLLGYLSAT
jgi:myo-inositol-1(or 4)-monophosphatase